MKNKFFISKNHRGTELPTLVQVLIINPIIERTINSRAEITRRKKFKNNIQLPKKEKRA